MKYFSLSILFLVLQYFSGYDCKTAFIKSNKVTLIGENAHLMKRNKTERSPGKARRAVGGGHRALRGEAQHAAAPAASRQHEHPGE